MKKSIISITAAAALSLSLMSAGASAQVPQPPVGWAPEGSPVAKWGRLKIANNQVQSVKENAAVQLRGMSFGWTSDVTELMRPSDFYNERVVAWLTYDWGASLVRAAVGVSDKDGVFQVPGGQGYNSNPAVHKSYVKNLVNAAIWQGIYVIIDWHSHHAESEGQVPHAFFKEMAEIYKDYPNVIYEIYNEPINTGWSDIKRYAEAVIDAIRAIDANNLIIVGTSFYSQKIEDAARSPISKTNIAYVAHFYCDHSQSSIPIESTNIPIFVSEFGLSRSDGDGTCSNDYGETKSWLDMLDKKKISWANWQVNTRNEGSSILKGVASLPEYQRVLKGNWTTNDLSARGTWVRNRLRGYTDITIGRKYKVNVKVEGQGTVSGNADLVPCATATLTATPKSGAGERFEGWILNGVGIATNPYSLEVCYDREGSAVFFPDNPISNSTFTAGTSGWVRYTNTGGDPLMNTVNGELVVTMPAADKLGANAADVRVQTTGVPLTTGRKYKLTFDAKSTQAGRTVQLAYRTSSNLSAGHKINIGTLVSLTTTMAPYEREFDMHEATTTAGVIAFYLGGGQTGGLTLDNVKLEDVGTAGPPASVGRIPQSAAARPFSASFIGAALVLTGGGRVADVKVYDMAGRVRLARSVPLSNSAAKLPLDRLPSGVYSVRYNVDGKAVQGVARVMLSK